MSGPSPQRKPDSFGADSEHTVIRPRLNPPQPGLVFRAHSMSFPPLGLLPHAVQGLQALWAAHFHSKGQALTGQHIKALTEAAKPMLHFVLLLREQVLEPPLVNHFLSTKLKAFEETALHLQCDRIEVEAARYVLCTVMDEFLGDSPWAANGAWARYSLLLSHFRETWGGEKVFQLLERFRRDPQRYINSLELIALCMSLGFKGKFHVQEEGAPAHEALRTQLHQEIAAIRGAAPKALSDLADSKAPGPLAPLRRQPWWLIPSLSLAVMACVYTAFFVSLNSSAQRTAEAILAISPPAPRTPSLPDHAPLLKRLRDDFATELQQSTWSIQARGQDIAIVIGGDGMFDSAKVDLKPHAINMLNQLASALQGQSVQLDIQGHTDNQAIRSMRFPSNWELSKARAEAVKAHLQSRGLTLPINTQGLAASQALGDNATAEGRARNRRVEIMIHSTEPLGHR